MFSNTEHVTSIRSSPLSQSEQVQACCTIAREKLELGDYEEGCRALRAWWRLGEWPRHHGLTTQAAAELLLTAGSLSGWIAGTRQVPGDQKSAQALLNGAIALFEQLGESRRAAEGRMELGGCYYRRPLRLSTRHPTNFNQSLSEGDCEFKAVALIRLASVERHSGRLHDALNTLNEAAPLVNAAVSWTRGDDFTPSMPPHLRNSELQRIRFSTSTVP